MITEGYRPPRPADRTAVQRGLDDSLWHLIETCWSQHPKCRPDVVTVASKIPSSCPFHSVVGIASVPANGIGVMPCDTISHHPMLSPFQNRAWQILAQHEALDAGGLSQSALHSIKILKRWYAADGCVRFPNIQLTWLPFYWVNRKGHAIVVKITDEIIHQSEDYFHAISTSIVKAKDGCHSAFRAAELGISVVSISAQGLQRSLASMVRIAAGTSTQSERIEGTFGRICAGFVQVIRLSPNFITTLTPVQISDSVHLELSKIITDSQGLTKIVERGNMNRVLPREAGM